MELTPEDFMRAALAAGATVEYAGGTIYATARPEILIATDASRAEPPVIVTQRLPEERARRHSSYPILKKALEPWTSSHVAHIAAALAVMHGARTGEWTTPGVDAILAIIHSTPPQIDMQTLVQCVQRATRYKHANKVSGQRITMSVGSFAAAMYDAMEVDSNFNATEDLEPKITSKKLLDTVLGLANSADILGGSRSIEFRKRSYVSCLQVFTPLK